MSRLYSDSLALWAGLASAVLILASPASGLREAPAAADRAVAAPAQPPASMPAQAPSPAPESATAKPPAAPPTPADAACSPEAPETAGASAASYRATLLGTFGRWGFRVFRCEPATGGAPGLVAIDPTTGRRRQLDAAASLDRIDETLFPDLALIARNPDRASREAGTLVLHGPAGAACRIADSPTSDARTVEDCRLTQIDASAARADCRSGEQPSWTYVYHLRSGDTLVFAAGEAAMAEDGRIVAGRFEFSGAHAPCPMTSANPDVYDGLVVVTESGFDLRDLSPQPPERAQPLSWVAADVVRYADREGRTVCRRLQATTPQVLAIPCP